MKVVILAGGYGTRLSEETEIKPKPMVEIGGFPIVWHIMKLYSFYGFNDFLLCLGYKGYVIKEYFVNYVIHNSDLYIDISNNKIEILNANNDNWKVTLVDTGLDTMTGGRILRVKDYLGGGTFMLTYGDGLSDLNLSKLLEFHKEQRRTVTVTAVKPPGRYGSLQVDHQNVVRSFYEKPEGDGSWVSGGFFVLEPRIFEYIEDDRSVWEREPLENLAKNGEMVAFRHSGFWKSMDTLRDKNELEMLWRSGKPPWKVW